LFIRVILTVDFCLPHTHTKFVWLYTTMGKSNNKNNLCIINTITMNMKQQPSMKYKDACGKLLTMR